MPKSLRIGRHETWLDYDDWRFLCGFDWRLSEHGYAQCSKNISGEQFMHKIVAIRAGLFGTIMTAIS